MADDCSSWERESSWKIINTATLGMRSDNGGMESISPSGHADSEQGSSVAQMSK